MKGTKIFHLLFALATAFALLIPATAQQQDQSPTQTPQTTQDQTRPATQPATDQTRNQSGQDEARVMRVDSDRKQKFEGIIVRRDPDSFILRDESGSDITVMLTNSTEVRERKSNPFRGAKKYPVTSLLRGLDVQVEGRGDQNGALVAEKIRFTDDDYDVARSIESRVMPVEGRVTGVEGRVDTAETRLTQAEANAQRLSGQLEELTAVANTARGGAKAAQETADAAIAGVKATVDATNQRFSALDDYEATKNATVNFKVNSAVLSPEAKAALDEIANQAKNEKGYVIQVTGFASSDGGTMHNRRLSERRADTVVRYMAENHDIPLRRIITPYGFGEAKPLAENTTREGREQNRRVEVAILVSKGLTNPINVNITAPGQSASNDAPRTRNNNEEPQRP